ncbi:MAG: chromosomal replication initiator protein DnaA [Acidaminococcus sp.]|jgi:chromosomal replication initiator protein|nr:chromosomal replication initiator protein DnaA [Acidaminococcus sp.]MCI2100751.1 chromosomal replication initiator protein DnaA [Acidaminococcus sp.]MCI2115072.1 chromosomal replication initiator protein DnaA [Acidaminococcus sp.]MCI2117148.1 chromosomal replication initiator protein DnaA [Acidaminococcus sp.]
MDKETLQKVWKDLLDVVKQHKDRPSYGRWVAPSVPLSLSDDTLILGVDTKYSKEHIESHFLIPLEEDLSRLCDRPMKVKIELLPQKHKEESLFEEETSPAIPNLTPPSVSRKEDETQDFPSNLSPKYVFENFVIGNSNRFAYAAASNVAEAPAKSYNPLFLYSNSGLGKTHLMNAIGNRIHKNHPEMKILYISSETFTNELINSIQNNTMEKFRTKYRNIDVLLIDDIQFLRKKESTQEEFFHTFETLFKADKQIIISSDRKPSELDTLEERLTSRFGSGLIVDIQPPDLETRMAILNNMAQKDHADMPESVISLIASNISTNIRELEGAYTKVRAFASFSHQPITEDLAIQALKDLNLNPVNHNVTAEDVQRLIVTEYHITTEELLGKKRTRNIAYPRQIAMYLCRELTSLSLPRIGEIFARDHSTVLHACEKITKDQENDPVFAKKIQELTAKLKK